MTNDVSDINVGKIENDDLISREYLINKISSVDGLEGVENSNLFAKHYMDIVKAAPSVKTLDPYDDYVSREAVELYIKGYIHEIITESGTDKNERTNSILRAILNGIKTMPSVTPKAEQKAILDKIRAEIENHCGLTKEDHCRYCSYCNSVMGVREILEIIDKYKAESEGEE